MRTIAYPLLYERVLPPHSPSQLGVSPSQPRRPGCTPRAASGRPCGVTRSTATGRIAVEAPQTRLQDGAAAAWVSPCYNPSPCKKEEAMHKLFMLGLIAMIA